MKRVLAIGFASLAGAVVGVISLFVWAGTKLYEGTFGQEDEFYADDIDLG